MKLRTKKLNNETLVKTFKVEHYPKQCFLSISLFVYETFLVDSNVTKSAAFLMLHSRAKVELVDNNLVSTEIVHAADDAASQCNRHKLRLSEKLIYLIKIYAMIIMISVCPKPLSLLLRIHTSSTSCHICISHPIYICIRWAVLNRLVY